VPTDWRKAAATPVSTKDKQEDPGNCRPVSLTSIPGKVMEQPALGTVSRHMKDKETLSSRHS